MMTYLLILIIVSQVKPHARTPTATALFSCKVGACYLVWFERKAIILELFRYANVAVRTGTARGRRKGSANYYCLPYDGSFINDASVLKSLRDHRLCTLGMQSVMSIGYNCLQSIQSAAKTSGLMPRHGLSGAKSNSTKVTAAVLEDLN